MVNKLYKRFEGLDTSTANAMVSIQRAGGWSTIVGALFLAVGGISLGTTLSGTDETSSKVVMAILVAALYGLPGIYLIISGFVLNSLKYGKAYVPLLVINSLAGGLPAIFCGLALYRVKTYLSWRNSHQVK